MEKQISTWLSHDRCAGHDRVGVAGGKAVGSGLAKRQAMRAGIGFTELSNSFAACDDPALLQKICDRLQPGTIEVFAQRWLHRLPIPFSSADQRAGYWRELSMRQVEARPPQHPGPAPAAGTPAAPTNTRQSDPAAAAPVPAQPAAHSRPPPTDEALTPPAAETPRATIRSQPTA